MLLKNVKVRWVFVNHLANTEHKKFKNCWSVTVMLNDEQVKTLENQGLTVMTNDEGESFIRFRRNEVQVSSGKNNEKPVCVMSDGRTEYKGMVGNGSVCNVQYRVYEWDGDIYSDFMGLQVLSLVEYGNTDGSEFDDESGKNASEFIDESSNKSVSEDDSPF